MCKIPWNLWGTHTDDGSARIEKQIKDVQDKSEKVKMEVRWPVLRVESRADICQIIQIQSAAQQAQEAAA